MRSPLNDALNRKWSEASATLEKLERELAAERERADKARREGWEDGVREVAHVAKLRAIARHGWDMYDDELAILSLLNKK